MPPGDLFQFHSYNYHLTCVRASTFVTFHAYNCLSKCLKIITCFKKQKFSLNQFKLLPSTGLSYRWTARRGLYTGFSHLQAPRGRYSIDKPQNSHDLINCSQNTRLNSVILGLSLENSHGRLYKKFVKRELIITMKSHKNNFPTAVFILLRCVYRCLWPVACVCVRVCAHIPSPGSKNLGQ